MDRTPEIPAPHSSRALRPRLVFALGFLAIVVIAASFLLDETVNRLLLASTQGHWNHSPLVALCSQYGDWPELMVLGLLGCGVARLLGNVRWQRILLSAMIASTLTGMAVNTVRLTSGRTRPRAMAEQGWYGPRHGERWLIGEADFNSFPSGHTGTAVGFAAVLLFSAPPWGVPAMLAALAIAISRILLGAHHPSDVVTAATLGLVIAWIVWRFVERRRSQSEGITDRRTPSGT